MIKGENLNPLCYPLSNDLVLTLGSDVIRTLRPQNNGHKVWDVKKC